MLKYSTPEKEGINSAHILEYVKSLEDMQLATHDIIIMRHGKIVFEKYWEPFHKDFAHRQYSVTKSFVSLAIGFAEQDGLLNLDDPISKYFPEEAKASKYDEQKNQTIRQMLMMSTTLNDRSWFAAKPEDRAAFYFENDTPTLHPAGTLYIYDSAGSFMMGALVERVTGKTLMEYLREKMFDKIGVSKEAKILKCPGGHSWGDSALICKPTDMLKSAMFCMNKGCWNGEQLLNEEYMTKATTKQIANSRIGYNNFDCQGYGYQFWMTYDGGFFFNGMGVQLTVCIPEYDMILVYNADDQGNPTLAKSLVMNNFFNMIARKAKDEEINGNEEAQKALEDYTKDLKLYTARGEKYMPMQDTISGVTYKLYENPMGIKDIKVVFDGDEGKLCYTNAQGYKEITFGMCKNVFGKFPQKGYSNEMGSKEGTELYKCAASAAWVSDFQLYMKVQIIDEYFGVLNINLGFTDGGNKIGVAMEKVAEDFLKEYQGFTGGVRA